MLLCVLDANNIIINKIEAPYRYKANQHDWKEWHNIGDVYSDTEPVEFYNKRVLNEYTQLVQDYLDSTAKQRNYDNIFTLCGYITDPNPKFQKEAQAAVVWRSAVWTKCYEILNAIKTGARTEMPTDIISELPAMNWGDTV